jgi:hypothetical protein
MASTLYNEILNRLKTRIITQKSIKNQPTKNKLLFLFCVERVTYFHQN